MSMLLLGGCLLGFVSYQRLPVALFPDAELPMLIVDVQSRGDVDPGFVESRAVIPLESAIAGLAGVDRIESNIDQRSARIWVSYTRDANEKYAFLKLEQQVTSVQTDLGDDFIVRVLRLDTEQLSTLFMILEVRGVGSLDQIRHVVDAKVVPELGRLDGIASV